MCHDMLPTNYPDMFSKMKTEIVIKLRINCFIILFNQTLLHDTLQNFIESQMTINLLRVYRAYSDLVDFYLNDLVKQTVL